MIDIFDGVEGWPVSGERLFSDEFADWSNNACFNFATDVTHGYIQGYRLAGRAVLLQAQSEPAGVDYFVYALVFSYRHFLELSLKDVVVRGNQLLERRAPTLLRHELHPIWIHARSVIEALEPSTDKAVLESTSRLIEEFDALDPRSETFRYAASKDGSPTIPTTLTRFNIRNFALQVERVGNFLEAVRVSVAVQLEQLGEMRAEFAGQLDGW